MTHPLDALFPSNDRIARGSAEPARPPFPGDMVTVARRFGPLEAELLRGRLAADGIPAVLGDAHTVQADALLTAAIGGVRVRVPTAYERQALRAVADIERGAFALEDGADVPGASVERDVADDAAASRDVVAARAGLSRLVLGALAGVAIIAMLAPFLR